MMNTYDTTEIVHRAGCPSDTQPEYKAVCIWCENDARIKEVAPAQIGKWQIRDGEHGSKIIYVLHDKYSYSPIAETLPLHDSNAPHDANARLIAAAPELLAALKQMLNPYHQCGIDCKISEPCPISEEARKVVAKAEGKKEGE